MLPLRGQQYLTSVPEGTVGSQADTMAAPQTALPAILQTATTRRESLMHSMTGVTKTEANSLK